MYRRESAGRGRSAADRKYRSSPEQLSLQVPEESGHQGQSWLPDAAATSVREPAASYTAEPDPAWAAMSAGEHGRRALRAARSMARSKNKQQTGHLICRHLLSMLAEEEDGGLAS